MYFWLSWTHKLCPEWRTQQAQILPFVRAKCELTSLVKKNELKVYRRKLARSVIFLPVHKIQEQCLPNLLIVINSCSLALKANKYWQSWSIFSTLERLFNFFKKPFLLPSKILSVLENRKFMWWELSLSWRIILRGNVFYLWNEIFQLLYLENRLFSANFV